MPMVEDNVSSFLKVLNKRCKVISLVLRIQPGQSGHRNIPSLALTHFVLVVFGTTMPIG